MHKFSPQSIDRLLNPERFRDFQPEKLLRDSGLKEGHTFADIGCGPGFFTLPAAKVVGPAGRVYAVDTQKEMLDTLALRNPPANVTLLLSDENTIQIEDSTVDFALAAYVLHEAENTLLFLKELLRIMKPGARLMVLDWEKKVEERGPPYEERLSVDDSVGLVREAGFKDPSSDALTASHYRIMASR